MRDTGRSVAAVLLPGGSRCATATDTAAQELLVLDADPAVAPPVAEHIPGLLRCCPHKSP